MKKISFLKSVRGKIILSFGIVVAVLSIALLAYSAFSLYTNMHDAHVVALDNYANYMVKIIDNKLVEEFSYVKTLANVLKDSCDKQCQSAAVNANFEFLKKEAANPGILRFIISDKDGNAYSIDKNSQSFASLEQIKVNDRAYFIESMKGKTGVTNIIKSAVDGKLIIANYTPILSPDNQIMGAMIVIKDYEALCFITDQYTNGKSGIAYILDNDGYLIAHKLREKVADRRPAYEVAAANGNTELANLMKDRIVKEDHGSAQLKFNGQTTYLSFTKTNSADWKVVATVARNEIFEKFDTFIIQFLAIGVILFAIAFVVLLQISGNISNPIIAVYELLHLESNYDFSKKTDIKALKYMKREDEIGIMINEIALMEENVRNLLIKTIDSTSHISAASEELTATVQDVAENSEGVANSVEEVAKGATEQANDAEKGARAIDEMGVLLEENQTLLNNLVLNADDVSKLKDDGLKIVEKLVNATNDNVKAAQEVSVVIDSTNESAKKIEKSSDMIKAIAEQTNLLALNAAIEAARAGDAGRGFAVVAEEIRKLAEDSNKFTQEIRDIVNDLTQKAEHAVETMKIAKEASEIQVTSVKQTQDQFEGISDAIESTKDMISRVNDAAVRIEEQKGDLMSIIENLSAISEENAASAEEISASVDAQVMSIQEVAHSSSSLAEVAQDLAELTSQFKI